ncbi:quinone-dependent dihydroorotate dehydrogenase [Buchnera aphidicola]|uniref:quinone-dependent dihydroorotate dehydrogenase n=1 Tax=Buchnera aphidicola TaxID=9 RepID=UPI0030EBC90A
MIYSILKKILFKIDPEKSHFFTFELLKFFNYINIKFFNQKKYFYKPIKIMGLNFKNHLGLSAGLDKNGDYINILSNMGFGFIELGSVTLKPQEGNIKPRIFRLLESESIINRMGFNNYGIDYLIKNLKKSKFEGIIGVNIGKNFNTPINLAFLEYSKCIEKVYLYTDYICINISSPNTKNLRKLQYGKFFEKILYKIKKKQQKLKKKYKKYVPILIKISPDLDNLEIKNISKKLIKYEIDGVIATNTTIKKSILKNITHGTEEGGLSGQELQLKSTLIIKKLKKFTKKKIVIIGSGGINSSVSAQEKLNSGANLIQIYSGLIYEGPKLIKNILKYTKI